MTSVIRITLSFLAAVTVISLTSDADAQLFRRLRDNIRTTYPPQSQAAPQRAAPVQPQGQYGRSLTPYSRLTPEQRNATANSQAPSTSTPKAKSDQVNVRIVTYYDPRTGRTFQRRFVLPPNNDASVQGDSRQKQLAGGNSPSAKPNQPQKPVYDKVPGPAVITPRQQVSSGPRPSVAPQPKSLIPSISLNQPQTPVQPTPVTSPQLPVLAGPTSVMSAPPAIQTPIAQVAPLPNIAITNQQVANSQDIGGEIVIDTAVAPATANSEANETAIRIGSAASDDGAPVAFSVLEMSDSEEETSAESSDFDIEIGSAEEVEAFFGE